MRTARDVIIAQRSAYLSEHDADGSLVRFWVALEAEVHQSVEEARVLMESLLSTRAAESSMVWMEFAEMERKHASVERCRGVYRRALGRVSDPGHAAALHNSFLEFEVKEGTLATLEDADGRCAARMKQLLDRGERQAAEAAEALAEEEAVKAAKKTAHNQNRNAARKAKRAEARAGGNGDGGAEEEAAGGGGWGGAAAEEAPSKRQKTAADGGGQGGGTAARNGGGRCAGGRRRRRPNLRPSRPSSYRER